MVASRKHGFTCDDGMQLVRPRLSTMVALAALSGYLAAPTVHNLPTALLLVAGVFLLSAAASIFNQVQERASDRMLPRTCQRPLATGRLHPRQALQLAIPLALVGTLLISRISLAASGIGLFALSWYNLIYTPLKQRTALVLLLGALGGALPPLLGWTVSGASPLAPKAVHLYLLLILWQVPHFWCLGLRDDLRGQQLGFKMVPPSWNQQRTILMVRLWSMALGALLLAAVPLGFLSSLSGKVLMGVLGTGCLGSAILRGDRDDVRHWATGTGRKLHIVLAGALVVFSLDPIIRF